MRRRLAALTAALTTLGVTMTMTMAGAVAPATGAPDDDPTGGPVGGPPVVAGGGSEPRHHLQHVPQTSDGVPGERAERLRGRRVEDVWTTLQTSSVAPGVTFEQFTLTGERGVSRGQLVRIDTAAPGIGFDLVAGRNVASRHDVASMMDADAVVGVNGDFFDIRDTDAPLGVALDRQRGFLNGVQSGWNSAFWTDEAGVPHIGELYADAVVRQRPELDITTVNSPSVRPGGVGLYTKKWGKLRRYAVTDGVRRGVRMVIVRKGRVIANRSRFPRLLRVTDQVLVGRGAGAGQLARFRVGQQVRTNLTLSQPAQMAVTGNLFLLRDGVPLALDDRDLHPRTAIGIDRDTHQLLLLVMDGRQAISRGSTMRELGALFLRLGAEDALNLDGGGSSIVLTRQVDGTLAVQNSPSDGHPRPVANGLQVTYDVPAPVAPVAPVPTGTPAPVPTP